MLLFENGQCVLDSNWRKTKRQASSSWFLKAAPKWVWGRRPRTPTPIPPGCWTATVVCWTLDHFDERQKICWVEIGEIGKAATCCLLSFLASTSTCRRILGQTGTLLFWDVGAVRAIWMEPTPKQNQRRGKTFGVLASYIAMSSILYVFPLHNYFAQNICTYLSTSSQTP